MILWLSTFTFYQSDLLELERVKVIFFKVYKLMDTEEEKEVHTETAIYLNLNRCVYSCISKKKRWTQESISNVGIELEEYNK